jgi:DNA polymerase-3 subunit delta'
MNSEKDSLKIENQPGFISLLNALEHSKLPNSNLLVCKDVEICNSMAVFCAKKVLETENPETCIDFLQVYPSGAMMQISVDQIRELCSQIYLSPKICRKKFVIIHEAERMHSAAANAFLKSLEEPPNDTIIFLTTSRLYAILPTITGRCSITRLSSDDKLCDRKEIQDWLANYSAWLGSLFDSSCKEKNGAIMQMYLLLTQLDNLLAKIFDEAEKSSTNNASMGKKKFYGILFSQIESKTAEFFEKNLEYVKVFSKVISSLEEKPYLVALNVNFMACIETFLIEIFQTVVRVDC